MLVELSPNLAYYANSTKHKSKLNLQLITNYFTWIKKFGDVIVEIQQYLRNNKEHNKTAFNIIFTYLLHI